MGYTRGEVVVGVSHRASQRWRYYLEGGSGRSVLGEFFTASETYVGVGWYVNF